jgi:hypothetical protein
MFTGSRPAVEAAGKQGLCEHMLALRRAPPRCRPERAIERDRARQARACHARAQGPSRACWRTPAAGRPVREDLGDVTVPT